MTASVPDPSRKTLASRLSHEMAEAEQQGFGTATVWLSREEADVICAALRSASSEDTARLDFLDRCKAAMTARDGSERGWRMSIDRDQVVLGTTLDPRPASSCRDAIGERMAELERARAAMLGPGTRTEPPLARSTDDANGPDAMPSVTKGRRA